jgi:hypothetical protein
MFPNKTLIFWFSEYGTMMTGIGYKIPEAPGLVLREAQEPSLMHPWSLFTLIHVQSGRSVFTLPAELGFYDKALEVAKWFQDQAAAAGFSWETDFKGLMEHKDALLAIMNQAQEKFIPKKGGAADVPS